MQVRGEQSEEEAKSSWEDSKKCGGRQRRWIGSHTTGHSNREGLRLGQDRQAGVPALTGGVKRAERELGPQLANNDLLLLLSNSRYLASGLCYAFYTVDLT